MKDDYNRFIFFSAIVLILAIVGQIYYKTQREQTSMEKVEVYPPRNTHFIKSNWLSNTNNINTSAVINSVLGIKIAFVTDSETPTELKLKNFELLQEPYPITFGEALDIANYVSRLTGIRPAFLLAILKQELTLEKFDMCFMTNLKTGYGVRITDGKVRPRTMHPTRDVPPFIKIMKELNKDPLKTLVTCPMSFGWGGAMGPADFIPSTWAMYKMRIENITKKPADPWDIQDAFLAAGLFLSDSGAKSKTHAGEWKSAMIYFSGSANSPHHFYADGTLKIAEKIQKNIDLIQAN